MAAGSTYTPIATTTVSGGSTSEVEFASISGSYTDLIIVGNLGAATNSYTSARFNSDTGSNYSNTELYGNGSSAGSDRNSNKSIADFAFNVQNQSGVNGNFIAQIMNYSNSTTYKTVLNRGSQASSDVIAQVGLWRSTAAITSVTLLNSGAVNFSSNSTFTLYGIAAA